MLRFVHRNYFSRKFHCSPFALAKKSKGKNKGNDEDDGEGSYTVTAKDFDFDEVKMELEKPIESLKTKLADIRIGSANPKMIENVMVAMGKGNVPLSSISQVTVKNPQTLLVQLQNQKNAADVSKAIVGLNQGYSCMLKPDSADVVVVTIPKITKEYREGIVKSLSQQVEAIKNSIKNIRRDILSDLKKSAPEDDYFLLEKEIAKMIDTYNKKAEEIIEKKKAEIIKA